jgi:ABC-type transporter Mla MlaB component
MEKQTEIDCGGALDISVVAQWWEQAQSALETAALIRLKADELQRIDAAGLQAILLLFLDAKKREITIQWDGSSPALHQAATLTGLNEHLLLA